MVEPLRHRQTKGAETDMPGLPPPRHIPTLPGEAIRGPSRSSTALDPKLMAQTDRQQSLQNLPTRTSSFGQTCLAQTGKEALAIVRAGERPVEALVSYGQGGHAPQQFVERRPARIHPA